ncbi:glycoside hydrolase family 31 protein [Cercophora newfieldiana]|uniref:alpha-glucosidase n=1 Tax=Cercophora newfieldiana TaxID=92897 RepID=A0AA39YSV2_9PEZI|nr:glycoside hydrolase family 31 protein [Cercophora newfieldiana]
MALFTWLSLFLLSTVLPNRAFGQAEYPAPTRPGTLPGTATATANNPVFTVPRSADYGLNLIPNLLDPEAVDPQDVCPGYKASNVLETVNGFTADLHLAGPACNVYGNDIEDLTLFVRHQADDRLHIQIQPRYIGQENETWFLLPEALVSRPVDGRGLYAADSKLDVSWTSEPSFAFTIKRKDTGDILFTTEGRALVFEDQFIEFGSSLPENYNLYGLGEVIHGLRLGNYLNRTVFADDVGDAVDSNIYGSHPIYLDTRYFTKGESGKLTYVADADDKKKEYLSYTHGVYLRNAHAHEVLLRPSGITWRVLGGTLDLYIYSGPTAEDVTKAYQKSAIGLPAMQQYWTLGYHQCRWGYNNWTELQTVIDEFANFEIPLETIWTDIDYMNQYRDFENDPKRFSYEEGVEFLSKLHANGQHYVPIVDSAIYAPNPENEFDAYPPFDRGVDANAFVLNPDGSIYYGAVWPGYTAFPDWVGAVLNGTGAINWWIDEFIRYSKLVAFDGIWIDMSEVASFCVGSCGTGNLTLNPVHPPFELPGELGNLVLEYPEGFELTNETEALVAASRLREQKETHPTVVRPDRPITSTTPTPGARNINWPPYTIHGFYGDMAEHALSPNGTHHGGTVEYDFHNLFGHQILSATYQALLRVFEGKRPFIIGRSTFAGSGKWAGHWGGDNQSTWRSMVFSISQALSFSIFGIPMFGVDTCGFSGNSNMELCARWMELSAFFPFYRNHNTLGADPQEPYRWEAVMVATKKAMNIRYTLLPYMYTLFARANSNGDTVMRALAWEFPNEPWLANADLQFMLGQAVMVTPCLNQGASTVNGVFPGVGSGTVWYDWYNQTAVKGVERGQNVTISAPLTHIPVYLRGGNIIPTQEPGMTTAESRKNPWGLIVALDLSGNAEGQLYLDDGESLVPAAKTWVKFFAGSSSLNVAPEGNYLDRNPLGTVSIMGVATAPSKVVLEGKELDSSSWTYSDESQLLILKDLKEHFPEGAWTSHWELTWA